MRPSIRRICPSIPSKFCQAQFQRRGVAYAAASIPSHGPLTRPPSAVKPFEVPQLSAPTLEHSAQPIHVGSIHEYLLRYGILKVTLGFADPASQYLKQLVVSLHEQCQHQLPISHSASRGWFWDVKPESNKCQTTYHRARSETMEEFPWHTDCSYEESPPRYFALHVLQHDRFGGGTLSAMNIQRLTESLSLATQESLKRKEYGIKVPKEFIKDASKEQIVGNLMAIDRQSQSCVMRFRRDIVSPLTREASMALEELDCALRATRNVASDFKPTTSAINLKAADIPTGSIIIMDNRRWLHARNDIRDPERHLRRLRWDAIPFPGMEATAA